MTLSLLTHGKLAIFDGNGPDHRNIETFCCNARGTEDTAGRISLNSESTHEWRRNQPLDLRGICESQWGQASAHSPVPGHQIRSSRSDQRFASRGNLSVWTSGNFCIFRPIDSRLLILDYPYQLDQRAGWKNAKLVRARTLKSSNGQYDLVLKEVSCNAGWLKTRRAEPHAKKDKSYTEDSSLGVTLDQDVFTRGNSGFSIIKKLPQE